MIRRITVLAALAALCGLLPAAAQEPAKEVTAEVEQKVEAAAQKTVGQAGEMAEQAGEMAEQAGEMAEQAGEMAEQAGDMAAKTDAPGMTLDEVLTAHYQAVGGKEAWKAVESVRFDGTMTMGPGMEAPFQMTMLRPGKVRLEFTFQGMTGVQASDGETAWMVMPFMGKNDPEEMPAEQARRFDEQADIEGPLFDWQEKGHTVELLGLEEIEGTEAYKVKVTLESGEVRYHYLDSEYFITIKQEGKTMVQGQEMEIETALGDYKELCLATSTLVDDDTPCEGDALMMAYSIESKPKGAPEGTGQVITITAVTVNPEDVEANDFAMPEKPAEDAAG